MRLEYEKIIQAINFFARKSGNRVSKLYFLKLIFLADRYHLRMYGRMITNDHYVAMQYGPVASETKRTFEYIGIPEELSSYAAKYLRPVDDRNVESRYDVDFTVFSETDIEALNAAWSTYKKHPKIVDFTHEFPEWKRHAQTLAILNYCPMSIEDFFLDAPKNAEYCPADKERIELNRAHFAEQSYLM